MNLHSYKPYTDYDQYCKQAFSLSFANYIEFASHHIEQVRAMAKLPSTSDVISMNAPFEIIPENFQGKQAVLLIHGFIASPYVMRAIGQYFAEKGFLVRAILLPGHGSSPGELLNSKLEHWQQAVNYGIESLLAEAEEVHLCGFSLGGTLADLASYHYHIKSLIKLAPAYGINRLSALLPSLTSIQFSRLLPFLQWNIVSLENNLASYCAFPLYGAAQVYLAIRSLRQSMKAKAAFIPSFIAAIYEDATVKIGATRQYFEQDRHSLSRMRLYSSKSLVIKDPRVEIIDSEKLAPRVLSMSHVALPIAPEDAYYGQNGSYYGSEQTSYYFGEINHKSMMHKPFKRLTYNPDFYGMINQIDDFLKSL